MTQAAWPMWVLSLADTVERRAAARAQFDALGLAFEFLDCVDGRNGLSVEFEKLVDRPGTLERYGYGMSDGEYACALSHQLAYKRIVDEQLPGAIIFEDDVLLTENLRRFYETRSYEAAPLIQFFYFDAMVWKFGERSTPAATLRRLQRSAWMAVGYSISADAAAKMLAASQPLRGKPDWPCDTVQLFGHYITDPRIVLHPELTPGQSLFGETRSAFVPEGFDYSAGYAKGWRRLLSLASWKRLLTRPFRERLLPGYDPTPQEEASRQEVAARMAAATAAAAKPRRKRA